MITSLLSYLTVAVATIQLKPIQTKIVDNIVNE